MLRWFFPLFIVAICASTPVVAQTSDASAEAKAWAAWELSIEDVAFNRFGFFAKNSLAKSSQPLTATVSFDVHSDRQIDNVRMETKSANVLFNVLAFQSIKSLSGEEELTFPSGTNLTVRHKKITFVIRPRVHRYAGPDPEAMDYIRNQHRRLGVPPPVW